ncbi:hypothetical protein OIU76_020420 [Salix suchowensis]|nr:hypothetical protein OIU76_020420 [Salix suchowensis]
MEGVKGLESDLEAMRQYFRSGKTKDTAWRQSQLKGLLLFIKENEKLIFNALKKDLGKHPVEAYRDEVGTVTKSINFALHGLKEWMSSKNELVPEPLGLVLIISSWNFPFGLSLEPLIGAIAAGNTAVLKPSELAPASASLLANVLPSYLDNKAVKVIQGGPAVGERLLQQKWDKIFFTGSARVKALLSWIPLASSWDKQVTVNRILVSKFGACAGQACIAIDYILVEKRFAPTLVELMKVMIKKMFGENPRETNTIARIVNQQHFLRLKNLLRDPAVQNSIVYGGSLDEKNLFVEPTILVDPPLDAAIMTEEIFGPLLPIITLDNVEDSIAFINSKPKPLAIYAFIKNEKLKRRMLSETSSGSLVFNDAVIQYAADSLPFGGIGESGVGKYHGKFSFDTFSHYKAVTRRSFLTDFWYRFPPWNDYKLLLLEATYNFDYLGMLLVILGLKRRRQNSCGV